VRWDAVGAAASSTVVLDPVLAGLFGDAIRMAGSGDHVVPLLEWSLIGDTETELWAPCTVQWDIWHREFASLRQAERRLRLLFHAELPVTIAGVGMWSQYVDGSVLASPARDNYFGRALRFQMTPLRHLYDRSGTP